MDPTRLGTTLLQGPQESFPVFIITIDRLLMIAATHHMISRSWILNPYLPRHGEKVHLTV
jgi:hypothetical protein